MTSTSVRGAARRGRIVAAAADLFARHGYAAVGMDAIGAAAGVTGPAIYRHFPAKSAVLVAVFDMILDTVGEIPAPAPDGGAAADRAALQQAVAAYARGVVAHRGAMAVFVREVHHLPERESARFTARQRAMVHAWRALLAGVHPDWSDERVRTVVHGAFGLLNAVGTFGSPLHDDELADQLATAALAALAADRQQH